jgi:8-oxo-dGTP pyrophosphatase MutT (NUDIX family)
MIKACGIIIFRKENNEHKYLVMRVGQFYELGGKGKQEPNETDFETALRETEEETGLTIKDLKFPFGRASFETEKYKKGKKFVVYFIAETDESVINIPFNYEIGKREHDAYHWLDYDGAQKVLVPRLQKALDWAEALIK